MRLYLLTISAIVLLFSTVACGRKTDNANYEPSYSITEKVDTMQIVGVDRYMTSKGDLEVALLGHGSIRFVYNGKVIQVDPYSQVIDYSSEPKADLILLTHEHSDHLDSTAIAKVRKENTHFITSKECSDLLGVGEVLNNGDSTRFDSIKIEAVPAYNIMNKKDDGEYYHPKGRGNGYVLTFGDKKVYVAGDTENIKEMKNLKDIYIAFLPKNIPYTMTDEMFVDAAQNVKPTYLYPYHFADFNDKKIMKALEGSDIKLQIRPMSNL